MFESIEVKEPQSISRSVNQTWHAIHAINAGTACDLSTAGCPVDQVLDLTAPTGATINQSFSQSINQSIKSNQIKSNQYHQKYTWNL